MGQLLLRAVGQRAFPDIEGAVLLAEIIERLSVSSEDRIAVLALEIGNLGEFAVLDVAALKFAAPDIAGNGRGMMLAPGILVSLLVMIEESYCRPG